MGRDYETVLGLVREATQLYENHMGWAVVWAERAKEKLAEADQIRARYPAEPTEGDGALIVSLLSQEQVQELRERVKEALERPKVYLCGTMQLREIREAREGITDADPDDPLAFFLAETEEEEREYQRRMDRIKERYGYDRE